MTDAALERVIHPVHAALLASSLPLFLGTLLCDWYYWSTYEVQWINFASWLIFSAVLLSALALLWAAVDFLRSDRRRDRWGVIYIVALFGAFVFGFVDALVHSKEGWASMPAGLILSAVAFLLALASVWLGFSSLRRGAGR